MLKVKAVSKKESVAGEPQTKVSKKSTKISKGGGNDVNYWVVHAS